MITTELNPFLDWFSNWGQVIYFVAQILFWVVIAAAAVEVARAYKRYVDHKTGATKASKKDAQSAAKPESAVADPAQSDAAIEVDRFVE
jgi:hypothetical protein